MEILVVLAALGGLAAVIMGCIQGNLFACIFTTLVLSFVVIVIAGAGEGGAVLGVIFLLIWGVWMARIYRRR